MRVDILCEGKRYPDGRLIQVGATELGDDSIYVTKYRPGLPDEVLGHASDLQRDVETGYVSVEVFLDEGQVLPDIEQVSIYGDALQFNLDETEIVYMRLRTVTFA